MNFLVGIRIFVAAFYAFTIWYDVNYVGMKFDPSVEKMGIFMAGRLMYLTGLLSRISRKCKDNLLIFFYFSLEYDFYNRLPIDSRNERSLRHQWIRAKESPVHSEDQRLFICSHSIASFPVCWCDLLDAIFYWPRTDFPQSSWRIHAQVRNLSFKFTFTDEFLTAYISKK